MIDRSRLVLTGVSHEGSKISDACLTGSAFEDVSLRDCSFHNVAFSNSKVENACMKNVDIRNAAYDGMKIEGILVTELLRVYQKYAERAGIKLE